MNSLLEKANAKVTEINKAARTVDDIEKVMNTVKDAEVVMQCDKMTFKLTTVLTPEQITKIGDSIRNLINDNYNAAAKHLEELIMDPEKAIENHKADNSQNKKKQNILNTGTDESGLDPDTIKKEYIVDKLSIMELARKYHVGVPKMRKYLVDNNIPVRPVGGSRDNKQTAKKKAANMWTERPIPDTDETINTIKALYTENKNRPFTMKQLAEEFHCEVKTMHQYCKDHGLLRPSKNDPFNGR